MSAARDSRTKAPAAAAITQHNDEYTGPRRVGAEHFQLHPLLGGVDGGKKRFKVFLPSLAGSGYCADAGIIVNGEWTPAYIGLKPPACGSTRARNAKIAFGRLGIGTGLIVRSLLKFVQIAAAAVAVGVASPVFAATDIMWWHAMSGELGKQVDKLAADFNASQSEYRIVPS